MGFIDNALKALRLLGGRRYTNDSLGTAQEAFDKTIDIGGLEVYTQDNAIPTSSLPFSGSSQHLEYYQTSGKNLLRYWFRQRLTKSNTSNETWFFMSPIGATNGVTPQLIQEGQQKNFISPKYSVSALANANTEDNTPGYGVKVFKSTSTNSGSFGNSEVVSTNDYQFDYKTGVLQFDQNAPSSNQIVYMTTYQYVGETLGSGLTLTGTGSFGRVETTTVDATTGIFTELELSGNVSSSAISTGSFGRLEVSTGKVNGDFHITDDLVVTDDAQVGGVFSATGNTIHGNAVTDTHTFTGNITASNNLTVGGTITAQEFHTEYVNSSIIFESGSTQFGDDANDTHVITGKMQLTGSLDVRQGTATIRTNRIHSTEVFTDSGSIGRIVSRDPIGIGQNFYDGSQKADADVHIKKSGHDIKISTTDGPGKPTKPHIDLDNGNSDFFWRMEQDNGTQGILKFKHSGSVERLNVTSKGIDVSGSVSASGDIVPRVDGGSNLGSANQEFQDLFIDGTANIDTLALTDDFTYGGVTFNEDSSMLSITGSSFKMKATDGSDLFTLLNNSDEISFQVDDKVVVLGARSSTPTAVAGGLFYSGSDQWFLGYENSTPPS